MIEVELKVRAGNLARVERALDSFGARVLLVEEQRDIYYTLPHRDFWATDEALRLRLSSHRGSSTEECYLTYKGPKLDEVSKSREELTVRVEGWEDARRLLQSLDFAEVGQVSKLRKTYRLGEFLISLDQVDKLGQFVEIEAQAIGGYDQLLKRAFGLLEKLGFRQEESIRESYLELLKEAERPGG